MIKRHLIEKGVEKRRMIKWNSTPFLINCLLNKQKSNGRKGPKGLEYSKGAPRGCWVG